MKALSFSRPAAVVAAVLLFPLAAWASKIMTPEKVEGVRVVGAEEVAQLVAKGVPAFDVRVTAECNEKTIKGAICNVYREKSAKVPDFNKAEDQFDLSKLPADKTKPVIFFCNSGDCWRSYKASVVARDAGYKQVLWFRGGMPEWTAKGLPTQ
ncbi:MAG: rhodanese-like domain-containing protein [Burkholderiaceae bacterium]|nr:rhodanese-like domain-containing protein [Burkholderiaceae bacterium]